MKYNPNAEVKIKKVKLRNSKRLMFDGAFLEWVIAFVSHTQIPPVTKYAAEITAGIPALKERTYFLQL